MNKFNMIQITITLILSIIRHSLSTSESSSDSTNNHEFNIKNLFGGKLVELGKENAKISTLTVLAACCVISNDFENYLTDSFNIFNEEEFQFFINSAKNLCSEESRVNVENYIVFYNGFYEMLRYRNELEYDILFTIKEYNLNPIRYIFEKYYKENLIKNSQNFPTFENEPDDNTFIISGNTLADFIKKNQLENIENTPRYLYFNNKIGKNEILDHFKDIYLRKIRYTLKYGFFELYSSESIFSVFKDNDFISYNLKGKIVPEFFLKKNIFDSKHRCFLIYEFDSNKNN